MGWTDWFSGKDSEGKDVEVKIKSTTTEDSHKSEKLSREPGSDRHEHMITKTDTNKGTQFEKYDGANVVRTREQDKGDKRKR
jgi:hypothetical protein